MKTRSRKHPAGLTVKEVLVVLFVFNAALLIFILGSHSRFSCCRGSDRSANILNIRNVQQAMRGHANMTGMAIGDGLESSVLLSADGTTGYMRIPRPPQGLPPYTYRNVIPPIGTLYVTNHFDDPNLGFRSPKDYEDW